MEFLIQLPVFFWLLFVFVFGTGVGSFLNVLVARLPLEKSVIWPSSRCFVCFNPIRATDNLPIIGYLRLRGRCRRCGAGFSAKYLWVEVGTGLAFVGLFVLEVMTNWHGIPAFANVRQQMLQAFPPLPAVGFWAVHAALLAALLASALIDAKYRVIPAQITYPMTLVGILCSTLLPWPWPGDVAVAAKLPADRAWILPEVWGLIPTGLTAWPAWGPLPNWAPPGSWKLGLLNGVVGAAVGMLIGRGIKNLFELGFGKEALGLGDADLLMMSGAFLGWQPIALALFVGAFLSIVVVIPQRAWEAIRGRPAGAPLPFGPGLAAGVVTCWLGWPWLGQLVQPFFFDAVILVVMGTIIGGGLLAAGLFLRRK
jgi:leader peptidase (prepilin peptidase)/N-methyltransferase